MGNPVPWLNYAVNDFLSERLCPELRLFEYGGGGSTLRFAKRLASVHTVDHNRGWYEWLKNQVPENEYVRHADPADGDTYETDIFRHQICYDIVLVDGVKRLECIHKAVEALAERVSSSWTTPETTGSITGREWISSPTKVFGTSVFRESPSATTPTSPPRSSIGRKTV